MDESSSRDVLWKAAYETFYYVYYDELLVETLIARWLAIDQIAKLAMALTATGSVVAGWSLWSNPALKVAWAILAGFGAVCAIVHTSWGITFRLRDFEQCKSKLLCLRIDLETFRVRLAINRNFSVAEMEQEFIRLRERLSNDCFKMSDIWATERLRRSVQYDLNARISNSTFTTEAK